MHHFTMAGESQAISVKMYRVLETAVAAFGNISVLSDTYSG